MPWIAIDLQALICCSDSWVQVLPNDMKMCRLVFIKFTDAVSALRAVNALEGRVFNGNAIAARFWDTEKFERGEYS